MASQAADEMSLPKSSQSSANVSLSAIKVASPKCLDIPTKEINKETVVFWIERSKNANIVVYEALLSKSEEKKDDSKEESGHFNDISGYWLDIDPAYQAKKRAKGILSDRQELTFLEKKMAYGYAVHKTDEMIKNKKYQLTLVALPNLKFYLITIIDKNTNKKTAKVLAKLNNKQCYVRKVYVETKESWIGLPKVVHIDVYGISIDDENDIQCMRVEP